MYTRTRTRIRTHTYTLTHTKVHTHTHARTHAHIIACAHTRTLKCMRTHTNRILTHLFIYIYELHIYTHSSHIYTRAVLTSLNLVDMVENASKSYRWKCPLFNPTQEAGNDAWGKGKIKKHISFPETENLIEGSQNGKEKMQPQQQLPTQSTDHHTQLQHPALARKQHHMPWAKPPCANVHLISIQQKRNQYETPLIKTPDTTGNDESISVLEQAPGEGGGWKGSVVAIASAFALAPIPGRSCGSSGDNRCGGSSNTKKESKRKLVDVEEVVEQVGVSVKRTNNGNDGHGEISLKALFKKVHKIVCALSWLVKAYMRPYIFVHLSLCKQYSLSNIIKGASSMIYALSRFRQDVVFLFRICSRSYSRLLSLSVSCTSSFLRTHCTHIYSRALRLGSRK